MRKLRFAFASVPRVGNASTLIGHMFGTIAIGSPRPLRGRLAVNPPVHMSDHI